LFARIKSMKVLFVCKGNTSRSQVAEVLYNHYTHTHNAESAGTDVWTPGMTLGERKKQFGGGHTIDLMSELGFDISKNRQTQLKEEMLVNYDIVINMCSKSISPEWLVKAPNCKYWNIKDPVGADITFYRDTIARIKAKILHLIES
jgi:protein-tyrosine phosphatase